MKIGLLTVPFNNNYGGMLQAFALKSVLAGLGNNVVIINRKRNPLKGLKFTIYNWLVKAHIIDDFLEKRTVALSVNTDVFKAKYLTPITEPYYSSKDLQKSLSLGIEAFVVGSDQVWRFRYALDSIDDYYFGFLKGTDIPRFSYAASFGIDTMDYPEEKIQNIKLLLKDFCGISVREESGKYLLENYLGVTPGITEHVLDPTLLLSVDFYVDLFKGEKFCVDSYLFTYVLDGALTSKELINSILCKTGLMQMDLKAETGDRKKLSIIEPVEKWLSGIYYSKYVLTDSFHGTVFSILFNRPFVVFANPGRGMARMKSLLNMFDLNDRLVMNPNEDVNAVLERSVDWAYVNNKLEILKVKSLEYIKETLRKAAK